MRLRGMTRAELEIQWALAHDPAVPAYARESAVSQLRAEYDSRRASWRFLYAMTWSVAGFVVATVLILGVAVSWWAAAIIAPVAIGFAAVVMVLEWWTKPRWRRSIDEAHALWEGARAAAAGSAD